MSGTECLTYGLGDVPPMAAGRQHPLDLVASELGSSGSRRGKVAPDAPRPP